MYETFEDAKNAAMDVIERLYNGNKMGCVIIETKFGKESEFSFRFYGTDTNGEWVKRENSLSGGPFLERRTLI